MVHNCKRCNHQWIARTLTEPKQCPCCKSYKWKIERSAKNGNREEAKEAVKKQFPNATFYR